jgi:uncharacterized membrane protein
VNQRAYRLDAIDMVRGLAIVVMALDHVRDYFMVAAAQDPLADPNVPPVLFFTRWVTHFCAPVFVLLAGTSAGLMTARKSPRELGRFLLTRGLWLIAVEIVVISTAWTFAPWGIPEFGGRLVVPMQVIWAIGASMVVLSAAQWLGRKVCLAIGLAIVLGHNLLDPVWPASGLFDEQWPLWVALHAQMAKGAGPILFAFVYPVLTWIGVILVGFGAAGIFEHESHRRSTMLRLIGLVSVAAFVVLRAVDGYGDPNEWQRQPGLMATVIDFLNTTKYPPSLVFLLMTIGPAAILCSIASRVPAAIRDALVIFGRAPFAFYVAHLFLIHGLSVLLGVAQGFAPGQMATLFFFYPQGYGISMTGVYVVWVVVVVLLYPLCRAVAAAKARRRDWWLSYV